MNTLAYFFSTLLFVVGTVVLLLLARAAQVFVERRLDQHLDRALSPDVCPRCNYSGYHAPACFYALQGDVA